MKKLLINSAVLFTLFISVLQAEQNETLKPKLILQITVDQLRGDLADKYMKNMGEGGFRYLKKDGLWYRSAFYKHSVTQTAVGHTTLATGAYPSAHGMISNSWYDRATKTKMYNVQDKSTYILSFDETKDVSKNKDGRSPKNIISSTFSDELSLLSNKKSKIFAVSVKDRGAVTLAGHNGKAFWFNKKTGEFVTSSFYYDKYPSWVKEYNSNKRNNEFSNKSWNTLFAKDEYIYKDDKAGEVDFGGFGKTFPHKYGDKSGKYFNYRIAFSPAGDELTLDFAKAIVSSENLGQNGETDFLAISFSATDYVGHVFGPSSMEAEDNLLRLDKTLKNLFAFIDKKVGLKNTLIVLSADHGAPETPEHLHNFNIESKHLYIMNLGEDKKQLKKLGIDSSLIEAFVVPYLYLDYAEIKKRGLKVDEVAKDVSSKLMKMDGVGAAIISSELKNNTASDTLLNRSAALNYNPERSGDILIINKVHYNVNSHKETVACNHGSPWRYDTFVPVIFAGYGIKGKNIYREIEPNNIAPTLCAVVGAKYPSNALKLPLEEVLKFTKTKGK